MIRTIMIQTKPYRNSVQLPSISSYCVKYCEMLHVSLLEDWNRLQTLYDCIKARKNNTLTWHHTSEARHGTRV